MAYISNTDIPTRLGSAVYVQLTDDAGTGSANTAVVDEARAGAEDYVGRTGIATTHIITIGADQHRVAAQGQSSAKVV